MKIQFDILFEIEILHEYYTSGISEDFTITPTRRCQRQLRNYGLLFRKTGSGFVVLYEVVEDNIGNPHPRKPIEEDVKFSFMLQSKNPYLLNYSELPLDNQLDQVYYLHNNRQNTTLPLTADAKMSGDDRITFRPQRFQHHFDDFESTHASAEIEIFDESSELVRKGVVKNVEDTWSYLVDVRGFPPGKFTLLIDEEETLKFYADDELVGKQIFGVIDIFRSDNIPATYQVILEARKTFWKYYVVTKYRSHITPTDVSISHAVPSSDPDNSLAGVSFNSSAAIALSDGTEAIPFVSSEEVPLQQQPIPGIHLQKTTSNNGGTFDIENLPNPAVTTLTPAPFEGKIYSDMFIYV